ncbi:PAS domain-containing protein [Streptomyces sp. PSKA28]|uniref:PAS domain-containing protein n=1 Tax=Streptomyces himalayensis subsp. himalayensis TaxID=2756131 RepID=A0A7W0IDH0_9ACTN|nr:PAS domain-containing protein [Streptomyces himalayensis subsp. himalayensis]
MKSHEPPGQRHPLPSGTVLDTAPAVVVADADSRITHWSEGARALWGHTAPEIVGRPLADLFTGAEGGSRHRDGRLLTAQVHVVPCRRTKGKPVSCSWRVRTRLRPLRHPLDHRRGPGAGAGLLPGRGAPGDHPRGRADPLLDRPSDAVHGVHGRSPVLDRRRRHGPRLPATPIQPIASKDVASAVAEVAAGAPLNGIRNNAGPEIFSLDELGRITLSRKSDNGTVVTDPTAGMFAVVKGDVLTDKDAHLAPTRYTDWLS